MALKHAEPALAVDAASGWPGDPPGSGYGELKRRIWFTLGALALFRLGTYLPMPGLDPVTSAELFSRGYGDVLHIFDTSSGANWPVYGGVLHVINEFSGNALGRMSIFSLSVMPYVAAFLIMRLMALVFPGLEGLRTGGEPGRRRFDGHIRQLTLLIAALQAYAIAIALESMSGATGTLAQEPGLVFRVGTVLTLACGTMVLVWLGEQISRHGLGNGVLLIILAGLAAKVPFALAGIFEFARTGAISGAMLMVLGVAAVAATALIVFMESATRRIVVEHPTRRTGSRMFGGDDPHLPLKLNPAGVIPPLFASLLMPVPFALASIEIDSRWLEWLSPTLRLFGPGQPLYLFLFALLIALACFRFRPPAGDPGALARSLKSSGNVIRGVRPGRNTAEYLAYVQDHLTAIGAVYLIGVCAIAELLVPDHLWFFPGGGVGTVVMVLVTRDLAATIYQYSQLRRS